MRIFAHARNVIHHALAGLLGKDFSVRYALVALFLFRLFLRYHGVGMSLVSCQMNYDVLVICLGLEYSVGDVQK